MEDKKLDLNLNAKAYIPKFMQSNNNNNNNIPPQMNQPQPNMFGGFDPNNPYSMNYYYSMMQNMPQMPPQQMNNNNNMMMNNNNNINNNNNNNNNNENDDNDKNTGGTGIVGFKKKKNKKKKDNNAKEVPSFGASPETNININNNNNNNNVINQMNNLNINNQPKQQQNPQPKQNPKPKTESNKTKTESKKTTSSQNNKQEKKTDSSTNNIAGGSKKEISGGLIEDSFEGQMIQVDPNKKPVSIVFVGHVDAGKSTISGSLLYHLGQIDERIIEKYQREAKQKNRESWFMAYIMDINEDEREKGKTIEIGKAFFETPHKRFTLLDAPGHAGYIPNLLQGACQADFAGLVISAKKGEFEAGFDKSGSTREHTLLLKALGVNQLIVMVNKMDEESVKWSEERYNMIQKNLKPFLKSCGYNVDKYVHWIPISGLNAENLIKPVDPHKCSWYKGPTLMELLDSIEIPERDENGPIRLPILDRYKETSLYIMGKLESGKIKYGETYTLMPTKSKVVVDWLFDTEERGVPYALPGESVRIRCKGIDSEDQVQRGYILCSNDNLCQVFNVFEAEIQVLELQENQIIADGFICMLHFHTCIEECSISIKCEIDRKTKAEKKVKFVRSQTRMKAFVKTKNILCGEKYENFNSLGRFSMRYEGSTIAIGKILKIKPYKKEDK
jgi:peptide chain release factor subunit 3